MLARRDRVLPSQSATANAAPGGTALHMLRRLDCYSGSTSGVEQHLSMLQRITANGADQLFTMLVKLVFGVLQRYLGSGGPVCRVYNNVDLGSKFRTHASMG